MLLNLPIFRIYSYVFTCIWQVKTENEFFGKLKKNNSSVWYYWKVIQ